MYRSPAADNRKKHCGPMTSKQMILKPAAEFQGLGFSHLLSVFTWLFRIGFGGPWACGTHRLSSERVEFSVTRPRSCPSHALSLTLPWWLPWLLPNLSRPVGSFPWWFQGGYSCPSLSSHSISYLHLSFRFFKYVLPTRLEACRTQVHSTLESECPQGLLWGPPFGGH